MADGSVRFISQSIDAGNPTLAEVSAVGGRSPYGVWGSMGSGRRGGQNHAERRLSILAKTIRRLQRRSAALPQRKRL